MSDEKLLPCPFCGGEPELHWINEVGEVLTAWVRCKCGCEHHERLTKEVAVKKWNSRHLPNDAQASRDRHTAIETAIRSYCRRQSAAAVQNGRIYYAGLSITDLVNDIEAALTTSGGDVAAGAPEPPLARLLKEVDPELAKVLTDNAAYVLVIRNNVIEECAKVADDFAAYEQTVLDRAHADEALSETGRKNVVSAAGSRQVAAEQITHDIRALAMSSAHCHTPEDK